MTMLRELVDRIAPIEAADEPLARHQAESTRFVLLVFLGMAIGYGLFLVGLELLGLTLWATERTPLMVAIAGLGAYGIAGGLLAMRAGQVRAAARLAVVTLFVGVTAATWLAGALPNPGLVGYLLVVATACVVLSGRETIAMALFSAATVLGVALLRERFPADPTVPPETTLDFVASLLFTGGLVAAVLWRTTRRAGESMAEAAERQRELEQRNRELRASETRLRGIVAHTRELIAEVDADGRVVYASPNHLEVTGRSAEEHIGRRVDDYIHPDDMAAQAGAMPEPNAPSRPFRIRRADGSWRWVEVSVTPIEDGDGTARVLSIARDVTPRIAEEERALKRRAAAHHAQKMEALGRLAGGMTHELNNLMTAITLNVDLIESAQAAPDQRSDHLSQIRDSAEAATTLTRRLAAFSRQSERVRRRVDLDRELSELASLLRPLVGEGLGLELSLDATAAEIETDPTELSQTVMNLVMNARDAVGDGASIRLSSRLETLEAPLACHSGPLPAGTYVALSVSDAGEGMDEETRARMFEPFFTRRAKDGASGLGLSLVHGVVRRSGGDLLVESVPGGGTTITAYFPRADPKQAEVAVSHAVRSIDRGNETVLVVEDRGGVRDAVAEVVRSLGYRVLEASSALDALELARRHEGTIDLLLTDVVMPGMQGPELASRLVERRPSLRVLFLTAYAESAFSPSAPADGAVLYKPTNRAELAAKLRQVLGARAREARPPSFAQHTAS